MRRRAALAVLGLLASTPAVADEFSEFRIPAHRVFGWNASLFSEAQRSNSSDGAQASSGRALRGAFTTQGSWLTDSEPLRTSISVFAAAAGNRLRSRTDAEYVIDASNLDRMTSEHRTKSASETWDLAGDSRYYPWPAPIGWELGARASGRYVQAWDSNAFDELHRSSGSSQASLVQIHQDQWDYQYFVTAVSALGIGRVRDATGVYDARILEDRLVRTGTITRPLSTRARQRLAALMYLRYAYGTVHERPAKYLWREIERILSEDGALREGGLDARGVLRAVEPLVGADRTPSFDLVPPSPILRSSGMFAGAVLAAQHIHYLRRTDGDRYRQDTVDDTPRPPIRSSYGRRDDLADDDALAGAKVEYHRPLGLRWQVDAFEQVLFPLEHVKHGIDVSSSARIAVLVADRWVASASVSHSRRIEERRILLGSIPANGWSVSYGGYLSFYLEDRIQLQVSVSELQQLDRPSRSLLSGRSQDFVRDGHVSLGVAYRFLGGFDAPGLVTPLRLGTRVD